MEEQLGDGPSLFQYDFTPIHKGTSIKTWMSDLTGQRPQPDKTPLECNITNACQEESAKMPINTLLNLIESFLRRVETITALRAEPPTYETI